MWNVDNDVKVSIHQTGATRPRSIQRRMPNVFHTYEGFCGDILSYTTEALVCAHPIIVKPFEARATADFTMSMILKDNLPSDVECLTRMEDRDELVRFPLVLPYGTDWGAVHSGQMIYVFVSRTSQFCDIYQKKNTHSSFYRILYPAHVYSFCVPCFFRVLSTFTTRSVASLLLGSTKY